MQILQLLFVLIFAPVYYPVNRIVPWNLPITYHNISGGHNSSNRLISKSSGAKILRFNGNSVYEAVKKLCALIKLRSGSFTIGWLNNSVKPLGFNDGNTPEHHLDGLTRNFYLMVTPFGFCTDGIMMFRWIFYSEAFMQTQTCLLSWKFVFFIVLGSF